MKVNLHYFFKIKSKKESGFGSGSGTLAVMEINLFRWLQRKENLKKLNLNIHLGASANTGRRTPPPSSEDSLEAPILKFVSPRDPDFAWPFPARGSQTGGNERPNLVGKIHIKAALDIYSFAENGDYCLHPPSFNSA